MIRWLLFSLLLIPTLSEAKNCIGDHSYFSWPEENQLALESTRSALLVSGVDINCSQEEVKTLSEFLLTAKTRATQLIVQANVQKRMFPNSSNSIDQVIKTLECIQNALPQSIRCHNQSNPGRCGDSSQGYILTKSTTNKEMGICFHNQEKFTSSLDQHQTKQFTFGVLFHELSHLCETKDHHEGTGEMFLPHQIFNNIQCIETGEENFSHWKTNADHFEYWFHAGFCIPEISCPQPRYNGCY